MLTLTRVSPLTIAEVLARQRARLTSGRSEVRRAPSAAHYEFRDASLRNR